MIDVTEHDWLEGLDPFPMLYFLRERADERRLRLFACACCRQLLPRIGDHAVRKVMEVAERAIDGEATEAEITEAGVIAWHIAGQAWSVREAERGAVARGIAAVLSVTWNAERSPYQMATGVAQTILGGAALCLAPDGSRSAARLIQAILVRDVFGNPFRPVVVDPTWGTWNEQMVVKVARAIYEERAFECLPILADALEDAGCDNGAILDHCRRPAIHVRGCWVVDRLLGKE
jgi:hypothetical protein